MSSVVLLPVPPPPSPPGADPTLAAVERETASRLGPFAWLTASGGTGQGALVAGLRTNAGTGGPEGLYLLRREAVRTNDRVRTVDRFDGSSGGLVVDFPYEDAPVSGERLELHHLHPDHQLRADVLAALRRCWLLDTADVPPPPPASSFGSPLRTTITEVTGGPPNGNGGWLVVPDGYGWRNGGNGPTLLAGVVAPRLLSGGPTVVDLTMNAFWLTAARQILAVAVDGAAIPRVERWGRSGDGWGAYANRGHLYLVVPAGAAASVETSLQVRGYRDAFGLVNGADAPDGPTDDEDVLSVPVEYAAAFAHIEAWRRHRDRLEASAAEGRFATQQEAAAEATRVASMYADWLFRPQTERGDPIASPWGSSVQSSPSGLGGSGALAGAVVNQNDPYR